MPNDDLVKVTSNFYDEDYIRTEKIRFFTAVEKKPAPRRPPDKKFKDISDILQEMRTRDSNEEFQPICVSANLSNLPQTDDGTVTNAQILGTLCGIRKESVTRSEFDSLKKDLIL